MKDKSPHGQELFSYCALLFTPLYVRITTAYQKHMTFFSRGPKTRGKYLANCV